MPINPTSFNPSPVNQGQGSNPFASFQTPSFNFQGVSPQTSQAISGAASNAPPGMSQGYGAINQLLTTQPQSVTNTVMPYLQQLYGMSAQGTLPFLQNQASQGVANVESEMGQRGLVGSSLEQAGIIGAQQAGQQSINSYVGNMAQQLAGEYMKSVGMDIGANNEMYQNLAQALGQELGNTMTYNLGQQEITAAHEDAQTMANASRYGANRSMWGSIIGGLAGGAGAAFGHFSDERMKKNVTDLKPISYEYKKGQGPSGKQEGFSAQNVKEVYPDAIINSKKNGVERMKIDLAQILAHVVRTVNEHHRVLQPLLTTGSAVRD